MGRYVINTKNKTYNSYKSNHTEAASIPSSVSSLFKGPENLSVPTMSEESPANSDYELTYLEDSKLDVDGILDKIHRSLGLIEPTPISMVDIQSKYYNRFKIPIPNEPLTNAVSHIFFVRPDLNLVQKTKGTCNEETYDIDGYYLTDQVAEDPLIIYSWKHNSAIIKQLFQNNSNDHEFMLYLSNKAASFSLSDEELTTADSSNTYGGWKVPYGRTTIPSKTSGTFTIDYYEDMNLSIYELHKIWIEYIANVYHGKWSPKIDNIKNKIFDYMSSVYYILCANDGETILFWSKYTGVFPTSLPSSEFSYQKGNMVNSENPLRIEYKYAWKEDFNPNILYDFNINANAEEGSMRYQPTFDPKVGQASPSWVGKPYIELCVDEDDETHPYMYKLRFLAQTLNYASSRD